MRLPPSVKSRPLILLTIRRTRRLNRRDLLVTKPLEIPLEIPPSSLSNLWRRVATGVRESVAGPVRNGGKSWKKRGLCVTSRLDPFPTSPRWREGRISYESFLGSWHFPPSFSPLVSWPSPVTIIHLDRFETIRRVDLLPLLWALSRNNDQANKLPR